MRCPRSVKKRMLFAEVAPRSRMQSGSSDAQVRASSPRPLERRVNFWDWAGALASRPDDEPRNSFMKSDEDPATANSGGRNTFPIYRQQNLQQMTSSPMRLRTYFPPSRVISTLPLR